MHTAFANSKCHSFLQHRLQAPTSTHAYFPRPDSSALIAYSLTGGPCDMIPPMGAARLSILIKNLYSMESQLPFRTQHLPLYVYLPLTGFS